MSKINESKKIFSAEEYLRPLGDVVKQLEKKAWFKKEGWRGTVFLYTESPPIVASIHIFKDHWFNQDRQGIHFETFIGPKEAKSRSANVVLHLLHTPTIPVQK